MCIKDCTGMWWAITISLKIAVLRHRDPWVALNWAHRESPPVRLNASSPPQIASSKCVPWTDIQPRSSSGRQNKENKGTTTHRQTCLRSYRWTLYHSVHLLDLHVRFRFASQSFNKHPFTHSTQRNWSKSRTSQRTRSCSEKLSSTVTSFRYSPRL